MAEPPSADFFGPTQYEEPQQQPSEPAGQPARGEPDFFGPTQHEQEGKRFEPEQHPTVASEMARSMPQFTGGTGEFLQGTFSDVPSAVAQQAAHGWQEMTGPSGEWGFVPSLPRRALGALTVAGSPQAALTPLIGHPMAAGLHFIGALFSPRHAALDVAETGQQPEGGGPRGEVQPYPVFGNPITDVAKFIRGEPTSAEQWSKEHENKPRALYSEMTAPAAQAAPMLATPKSYTASPYHTAAPMVPREILNHEQIFDAATQAGYQALDKMGVRINANTTSTWPDQIRSALYQRLGLGADLNAKNTFALLDRLEKHYGPPTSISELDAWKQSFDAMKANPQEKFAAITAKEALNDLITKLQPRDLMAMQPGVTGQKIAETLAEARQNYAVASRMQRYAHARELAEDQAAATGSGANLHNKLRQAATSIKKTGMPGATPSERQAVEDIIHVGTVGNTERLLGKMAPTGVVSGMYNMGLGFLDKRLPLLTAGVGHVAKALSEARVERAWDNLMNAASRTSPATRASGMVPRVATVRSAIPAAVAAAHRTAEAYQP